MKKNSSKSTHKKAKTVYTVRQESIDRNSRLTKNSSQVAIPLKRNTIDFSQRNCQSLAKNLLSSKAVTDIKSQTNILSLKNRQNKENVYINGNAKISVNGKNILDQNKRLIDQNKELKQKVLKMQEDAVHDKQKIKNLITRISDLKRPQSQIQKVARSQSKEKLKIMEKLQHTEKFQKDYCNNKTCEDRKKYLQSQLYKERVKRNDLQLQKRKWEQNKNQLRNQYRDLLNQIQDMRVQREYI